MNKDQLLAAIDLGSNSFRLSIGTIVQRDGIAQIYAVDRLKETVRLAAGLNENQVLNKAAIERAVAVLKRFGDRLEGFPPERVRAVATNTFRVTKNIDELLPKAEAALGFPIEVISGPEEARLIYSGVAHELPPSNARRLIVDIGGGSTEFIIGQQLDPKLVKSLHMGCVSFTQAYFPGGIATEVGFERAELAAQKELEAISKPYRKLGWEEAYGSSGTAKALVAVLQGAGFTEKGITLEGLLKLKKVLLKHGLARVSDLSGLKDDRAEVLPAGLAIMIAIFKSLKINQMNQGEGALRVGVLYDMMGRQAASDKRNESAQQFMHRYHVSLTQAQRVKALALYFYDQLHLDGTGTMELRQMLGWAAELHEVGLSISQSSYHRHSAYILANADMPGFSRSDQKQLSLLVLAHQGRLSKLDDYAPKTREWLAILCLRLAVIFMRKRNPLQQQIHLSVKNKTIQLSINAKWLEGQPLIQYNLELEAKHWQQIGYHLQVKTSN